MKIKRSVLDKLDIMLICPYCGDQKSDKWGGCCGEVGHFEEAVDFNEEICPLHEIEIIEED